jgi:hypothetical protein
MHGEGEYMSGQELQKTVEAVNSVQNDLSSSPQRSLDFLVKAGILTPEGKLTGPYSQAV